MHRDRGSAYKELYKGPPSLSRIPTTNCLIWIFLFLVRIWSEPRKEKGAEEEEEEEEEEFT